MNGYEVKRTLITTGGFMDDNTYASNAGLVASICSMMRLNLNKEKVFLL